MLRGREKGKAENERAKRDGRINGQTVRRRERDVGRASLRNHFAGASPCDGSIAAILHPDLEAPCSMINPRSPLLPSSLCIIGHDGFGLKSSSYPYRFYGVHSPTRHETVHGASYRTVYQVVTSSVHQVVAKLATPFLETVRTNLGVAYVRIENRPSFGRGRHNCTPET